LARGQTGIACGESCATASCETVFIDIEVVTDSIRSHFNSMIGRLKEEKEAQVREWTKTMMQVFNDQKYALCGGLENCRSRKRNQDERRYIETSRIAAAAADFNLVISGRYSGEGTDVDTDKYHNCDGPGWTPTEVVEMNGGDPGNDLDIDHPDYVGYDGGDLDFGSVTNATSTGTNTRLIAIPQELNIVKNEYPTIVLGTNVNVIISEMTNQGGYIWNNGDGTIIYYPAWDWVGTDTFDFVISDGQTNSLPATITINVT